MRASVPGPYRHRATPELHGGSTSNQSENSQISKAEEEIMQTVQHAVTLASSVPAASATHAQPNPLAHYQIIRRNGGVVPFEPNKITVAMMKAFLAVHGKQGAASASVPETKSEKHTS